MRGRHEPKDLRPSLGADRSGFSLIYVTLMIPVIIAFALMAVDAGRLYILSTSLQQGTDAIALAMAAELDHRSDAITRAERAKDNLVTNPATFTRTFSAVDGNAVNWRFLKSLPASDATTIDDATYKTTNAAEANYVEVTVKPARFDTIFPASFIRAVGTFNTSAVAIAGLTPGACNIVPMFICNPLEPDAPGGTPQSAYTYRVDELLTHVKTQSERRKLFALKSCCSGSAQFSPGNFGYVTTPLGKGGRSLDEAIASANPGACVTLNGLTTKPGNTSAARNAFNVRFDMYAGPYNSSKNDPNYRPARNNRKSCTAPPGNQCNTTCTDYNTVNSPNPFSGMGFPRDTCLVNGSCTRLGGGDWNGHFSNYMRSNFGGSSANWPKQKDGSAFSTTNLPSRYEVYRAEIDQGFVSATSSTRNQGMAYPVCYSGGATDDSPDRRLLLAAIANCKASPPGSGSSVITAAAFGLFFLTEPVVGSGSSADTVYAELVDVIQPGAGSGTNGAIVTDNVQLYR